MPVDLERGERVVGKPLLHHPTEDEIALLDDAREALSSMPPFPGGDRGHFHPDYAKVFRVGIGGMLDEIEERLSSCDPEKRVFYAACRTGLEGVATYARRVAAECREMARSTAAECERWREIGRICDKVATDPPGTFHEAIQLMFLVQIALWFGEDHGLTSPGRMDRTLQPFYEEGLASGALSRQEALELISCLFIQMNRILWPGSAVAVLVGGRDDEARDTTSELTYLCLAARLATGLIYPTVGLSWHPGTPGELMELAVAMMGTGVGDPALFNDETVRRGLRDHGVADEDAANWLNSTCVEVKLAGASNIWVTQPYFNLPQALLEVIEGAAEEGGTGPRSFEELLGRVKHNLAGKIAAEAERLDGVWQARSEHGCFPLASCFIRDCLERGLDFDRGGARYNWVENSFVGLANVVDGLVAVRALVYESKEITLPQLHRILAQDFEGHEALRQRILHRLPKYGNDEEAPDALAKEVAEFLLDATGAQQVGPHPYVPGLFCWVMHERLGSSTGATPDGRRAGLPLADGAGPAQGRENRGPTASVLSTTKWDHSAALGGVVYNARFSADLFRTVRGRGAVRGVLETYLRRGGFEVQVNVVDAEQLRDAQEHPDRHEDLLVRVAGYSDYFVHLNKNTQDEIIARTEFTA
ncbi:MAG: pyruvate formate lyase family protein [Candidatus Brocadiaceae bacterium]|jgi:formate C-acetyltransferase